MKNNFRLDILLACITLLPHVIVASESESSASDMRKLNLSVVKGEKGGSLGSKFLQKMAELFDVDIFVESGTFCGGTAEAARHIFKEVHTIELDDKLYAKAVARFAQYPNVHVHHGDSAKILFPLLQQLKDKGKVLFWLDAHYSGVFHGVSTAQANKNTPIIDELHTIKKSGLTNSIILVDDMNCFEPINDIPADSVAYGYPTVTQLSQAMLAIDETYKFVVYGNIAMAFSDKQNIEISPFLQAMTTSRLFNGETCDVESAIEAERIMLTAATENEIAALQELITWRGYKGVLRIYEALWNGLAAYGREEYEQALTYFLAVHEAGYKHWRINWYLAQVMEKLDTPKKSIEIVPGWKL